MAVAEMSKLNLAAMSYDKDAVLNALQRTGAAEIKLHSEAENTQIPTADCEELRAYLNGIEEALERLCTAADAYNKQNKIKSDLTKDGFDISYSQFMSAKDLKDGVESVVAKVNSLTDGEKELSAELSKVRRAIASAEIYSSVKHPLKVNGTQHTRLRLGTVPASLKDNLLKELEDVPLSACTVIAQDAESALILVAAHKAEAERSDGVLQTYNFSNCPFDDERTGEEIYNSLKAREEEIKGLLKANAEEVYALSENIRNLRIYSDYIAFELEKAEANEKLRATQSTFLLEAYVPKESEELVSSALSEIPAPLYFEFSKPSADEEPPTLLKNNKVISNFEAVTNMYSPPRSREFDPNTVMAFFYSVFLGFIMADVGYGIMMILGGAFLWIKKGKRGGMIAKLGGVFAIGGIFTVIWGVLFNSFFGWGLLPFKVMPDMDGANMSWSLAGIKVPALLVVSMLIGVVQIFAGYVCRAVQCWRRKQISDGIFDGLVWAIFSIGVELAIAGFVEEFNVPILKAVGGITAGASLVIAIFTAGRKEKLLGKFTKGFGSAYGVINYASDILSYARLYGLMLAGATIAGIIADKSVLLIGSGNVAFAIIGVLIIVIGHVFNLAIGLLGAYIHDARLQYVEFYGRFYEGEGKLFEPLGSTHKHVFVSDTVSESK